MENINYELHTIDLSIAELTAINGGSEFKGSWWCIFCWVDYWYQP